MCVTACHACATCIVGCCLATIPRSGMGGEYSSELLGLTSDRYVASSVVTNHTVRVNKVLLTTVRARTFLVTVWGWCCRHYARWVASSFNFAGSISQALYWIAQVRAQAGPVLTMACYFAVKNDITTGCSAKLNFLRIIIAATFCIIGLTNITKIEFLLLDWIYRSITINDSDI